MKTVSRFAAVPKAGSGYWYCCLVDGKSVYFDLANTPRHKPHSVRPVTVTFEVTGKKIRVRQGDGFKYGYSYYLVLIDDTVLNLTDAQIEPEAAWLKDILAGDCKVREAKVVIHEVH